MTAIHPLTRSALPLEDDESVGGQDQLECARDGVQSSALVAYVVAAVEL
jgi:hypothetical protein